ncbi:MAG: hypothetical protein WCP93_04215 [Candidatus Berkelbacteria bacterium]
MYYYIMEPASAKASWQEKVKDTLGDLGIAGETVFPSPARTIEELAALGIMKGYSTIVAVGSEKIVNKIVTAMINQNAGKDTVLGIIPEDYDSKIAKRIGVSDYKEACQALKFRKLKTIDICCIEPNKYFMTEAVIETTKTTEAYLAMDKIQAGIEFNKITIKPGIRLEINDFVEKKAPSIKNLFNAFIGRKQEVGPDIYSSLFHSDSFQIETPKTSLPVKVDDDIVAKTPIICHQENKALKIVVAKDNIIN